MLNTLIMKLEAKETYYARCSEYEKVRKEANANPKEIAKVFQFQFKYILRLNIFRIEIISVKLITVE